MMRRASRRQGVLGNIGKFASEAFCSVVYVWAQYRATTVVLWQHRTSVVLTNIHSILLYCIL